MEEVIKILSQIKPGVNFETEENLIDNNVLTSFEIIKLVMNLSQHFDIKISPVHIVPKNFQSAKLIYALVQKLIDED